jgi:hypothetical protein
MRVFPGGIFLLVALAFGAGAVHFFLQFADDRINGLRSVGTVLRVQVYPQKSGGKSSYTHYTHVKFATADGAVIEHSFHDEMWGAVVGDQVGVLYKPDNPQDVIDDNWDILFLAGMMMLGAWAGVVAFYSFPPGQRLKGKPLANE